MLPDGSYDVVVVDATDHDDGTVAVEVAILAGDRKGELVQLRARGLGRSALDLLASPGTVTVAEGTPDLTIED